jgi:hypothetical protein
MDGDDILVSTMSARSKAKAVRRNPKVSLCVLDENWPPSYLTAYCDATIDATVQTDLDAVVALNERILAVMAGRELDRDRTHEHTVERAIREDRVKLPASPVRHLHDAATACLQRGRCRNLDALDRHSLPWSE